MRILLDDGSGTVADSLRPLHTYLLSLRGSEAVLKWIRREPVPSTLRGMAGGTLQISHRTIDALDQSTKVRYLRRTLVSAGVLPDIDVLLNDLEVYAARLLATLPIAHSVLIGRFYRWSLLPLVRRTLQDQPMTHPMFGARRRQLRLIAEFLQWLDDNEMTLHTVDQPAIDKFIAANRSRLPIGSFVTWAVRERIADNVNVTLVRRRSTDAQLSDSDLSRMSERAFARAALPLSTRLIILFTLIFAQPVETSIALTKDHVHDRGEHMSMTFAKTPIRLPTRLAELVRQHIRDLDARGSHHPNDVGWLFPGTMPNQHITAASVELQAARHGFGFQRIRSSMLQHFAQTVPASVLSDVVGISTNTAYRRSVIGGGVWRDYPGLRSSDSHRGSLQRFYSPSPGHSTQQQS